MSVILNGIRFSRYLNTGVCELTITLSNLASSIKEGLYNGKEGKWAVL